MKIWVDGNPVRIGLITEDKLKRTLTIPPTTHNVAEYKAIIFAIDEFPTQDLEIFSDSMLAVQQLNGTYEIKEENLQYLAQEIWAKSLGRNIRIEWIDGTLNPAHKLVKR